MVTMVSGLHINCTEPESPGSGTAAEKMAPLDWLVSKPVIHFLD